MNINKIQILYGVIAVENAEIYLDENTNVDELISRHSLQAKVIDSKQFINELQKIITTKMQCIKDEKFETAALFRDKELQLIKRNLPDFRYNSCTSHLIKDTLVYILVSLLSNKEI
jgi:hypothetical protein